MIVFIHIPRDSSGLILSHTTWRASISAATALLRDIHGRRQARKLPEIRIKAFLEEMTPKKAPPGRFKLERRYRVQLDGLSCTPQVKPINPWRPKAPAQPKEPQQ